MNVFQCNRAVFDSHYAVGVVRMQVDCGHKHLCTDRMKVDGIVGAVGDKVMTEGKVYRRVSLYLDFLPDRRRDKRQASQFFLGNMSSHIGEVESADSFFKIVVAIGLPL